MQPLGRFITTDSFISCEYIDGHVISMCNEKKYMKLCTKLCDL